LEELSQKHQDFSRNLPIGSPIQCKRTPTSLRAWHGLRAVDTPGEEVTDSPQRHGAGRCSPAKAEGQPPRRGRVQGTAPGVLPRPRLAEGGAQGRASHGGRLSLRRPAGGSPLANRLVASGPLMGSVAAPPVSIHFFLDLWARLAYHASIVDLGLSPLTALLESKNALCTSADLRL
jgi:hypothetical protein